MMFQRCGISIVLDLVLVLAEVTIRSWLRQVILSRRRNGWVKAFMRYNGRITRAGVIKSPVILSIFGSS